MDLDLPTVHAVIGILEKRIDGFWTDLKMGHIQRVVDGINKEYVDENQALIVVDHLMRIRTYEEVVADLRIRLAQQETPLKEIKP